MAFEVYKPRSSRENVVALTKHHIRLGRKLAGKLNCERVEIAYDKETKSMRIRGTEEGGMMLNKNKIGARGIFKYFDIEDKRGTFPAVYDAKENAIFVTLDESK